MSRPIIAIAVSLFLAGGITVIRAAGDPPREPGRAISSSAKSKVPDGRPPALRRHGWESDEDFEIRCRLSRRLPDVDLNKVELQDALQRLADLCDVNIAPDWPALDAAGISTDTEVTVRASNVCGDSLLRRVLEAAASGETQLEFDISRGFVEVSTKEDMSRNTITHSYDCADLLYADDDELARHIDQIVKALVKYGNISLSRDSEAMERVIRITLRESREAARRDLKAVIISAVDPESWVGEGGNVGALSFVGTQMVVTQTRTAQMEIDDLLESLRAHVKKSGKTDRS
jgi:hypothetical protein